MQNALPDEWSIKDGKLHRVITFNDPLDLAGFITKILIISEKYDHHPECRFCYKTIEISLWTHSSGSITEKDHQLANALNQALKGL